jgi:general secretion pathway protein I
MEGVMNGIWRLTVVVAVLAVGAVSLLAATEGHSARIGQVVDRISARWAAEARLTELRLGLSPEPGPVESYGRSWDLSADVVPTDDPALARLTVEAAPAGSDRALVTLTGYLDVGGR